MSGEQQSDDLCFFCGLEPGGKYGIGEKCRAERFQIYDLRPAANGNGNADFTLSHVHRQLIRYMGERSGETFYEWSKIARSDDQSLREEYRRYGEPIVDHVKRLIKNGLIRETPIIGQTRVLLRLTPWGFKIYEQIKNQLEIIGLSTQLPKS